MSGIRQPVKQPPVVEEGLHEFNVHEMRAAEIWIIEDVDVAILGRAGPAFGDQPASDLDLAFDFLARGFDAVRVAPLETSRRVIIS